MHFSFPPPTLLRMLSDRWSQVLSQTPRHGLLPSWKMATKPQGVLFVAKCVGASSRVFYKMLKNYPNVGKPCTSTFSKYTRLCTVVRCLLRCRITGAFIPAPAGPYNDPWDATRSTASPSSTGAALYVHCQEPGKGVGIIERGFW